MKTLVPRAERHSLILQVAPAQAATSISGWTENISASGLFIQTHETFAVGDAVHVDLILAGLREPIHVDGAVVWLRPAAGNQAPGIGLRVENEPARRKLAELSFAASATAASETPEPYRVVIAEDNPLMVSSYRRVLRKAGEIVGGNMELAVGKDGYEALELIRAAPTQLVITDMYMPVMDGLHLIEAIRADPAIANVAILVITVGEENERAECLRAGADAFLEKPIQFGSMLDTMAGLRRLVALRRNLQARSSDARSLPVTS